MTTSALSAWRRLKHPGDTAVSSQAANGKIKCPRVALISERPSSFLLAEDRLRRRVCRHMHIASVKSRRSEEQQVWGNARARPCFDSMHPTNSMV